MAVEEDEEDGRRRLAVLQSDRNLHVLIASTSSYTVSSTTSTRLPIRNLTDRISYDILSEIFLSIVQGEAHRIASSVAPPPSRYPWTVAGVCSQWREICLATPRLWSYIAFNSASACKGQLPIEKTRLQLERARSPTPLVINGGEFLCKCENYCSLWKVIALSSHRWEELYFGYTRRAAKCYHYSEQYLRPIPFPIETNRSLINLRSLTLRKVDNPHSLGGFPWDRLTHLSLALYDGQLTDLLSILTRCQTLVHLDLYSSNSIERGVDEIPISQQLEKSSVSLPRLASLALQDDSIVHAMKILPVLRLPSLRSLSISPVDVADECSEDRELLMSLFDLTNSSSTVTELAIASTWWDSTKRVVDFLQKFPQLRILALDAEAEVFLEILCQKAANGMYLCPSLEQLRLYYGSDYDPYTLVKMVELRMKDATSPASLKSIHISYDVDAPIFDGQQKFNNHRSILVGGLHQFIKNGLELSFIPDTAGGDISESPFYSQ